MRLTSEQVRDGLLNDDVDVRQRSLDYFTDSWSSDESVMPVVTQVIDARGCDAFRNYSSINRLVQTDATIEWVVRSLRQTPQFFDEESTDGESPASGSEDEEFNDDDDFDDDESSDFRNYILLYARGELLLKHRDQVMAVLPPSSQEALNRRLEMLSESPAVLWDRLITLSDNYESGEGWDDFTDDEADDLVACLGELGSVPAEQLMERLRQSFPEGEDTGAAWLEPRLVVLAGLIRHEPVLPFLFDKLREGAGYVGMEVENGVIQIGTDRVVRTIESRFVDEEWDWQLFAANALGRIHSDEAIRAATILLQNDSIVEAVRQMIAHSLVCQFSTEALQTVDAYLDSHTDWIENSEWTETLRAMRVMARILQVDLPRLDDWQTQMDEAIKSGRATLYGQKQRLPDDDEFDDDDYNGYDADEDDYDEDLVDDEDGEDIPLGPPATVVYETPRVGRNDPCPCGSGKKFKKCCLNKVPHD